MGVVPVLVSLVDGVVARVASDATSSYLAVGEVTRMQLVCTALARLAEDDELSVQARSCDAVSRLGKLLLTTAPETGARS